MKYTEFLNQHLGDDQDLIHLFLLLFESVKLIAENIDITKAKTEMFNVSGDKQLEMDVLADVIIHDTLLNCGCVSILASEERPDEVILNGDKFAVVYDPLDGSSLIDANLAIGTIFGVFRGTYLLGRTPRDMVGAMYAVYGPKTTVTLSFGKGVYEFVLKQDGFELSRSDIKIAEDAKYFAPGNLRATNKNQSYKKLVQHWMDSEYTLRYSGGMVPDINHIFVKGSGIFAYPGTPQEPLGKLRLLYECGPMAYLVENAGGQATDGFRKILDMPITDLHQRTPIFIGSTNEVAKVKEFM
jgi:fructose-1,6-bisphosphatase